MEIGKTLWTYGRTDGHLSSNLLGHRLGDDLKIKLLLSLVAIITINCHGYNDVKVVEGHFT